MECGDKYVQRVISKYNRRHVIAFVQKKAERRFLAPLGLTLKHFPSADFGNNRDRLNFREEFELFASLHYMKYKITKVKIRKCRDRYLQIYLTLRNRGISANWLLVHSCVQRHMERFKKGIDKAQLIERGYISLISSVDGFDPWLGYRFSTYACNSITRSFLNRDRIIRPAIPIDEVNNIGIELADEEHELWLERMSLLLQSDHLSPKEKEVLRCRFYAKLTLKEVGIVQGLTKERIRQIQMEALAKLRDGLNKDTVLS